MTDAAWGEGTGLWARPTVVLHASGTAAARIATVGGRQFADLPDLLRPPTVRPSGSRWATA